MKKKRSTTLYWSGWHGQDLLRKQGRLHLSVNQLHGARSDFGSDVHLDKHLADSFINDDDEFKMRTNLTF